MSEGRVWFITGASRGFGLEVAKVALKNGDKVVATARDSKKIDEVLGKSEQVLGLSLDVTKEEQVNAAVLEAVKKFGRIDVLFNNAGYGFLGVFEETNMQEIRTQFETNFFGVLAMTKAVAPIMRQQKSGHVINVSSIAGIKGTFGTSIYCASKFAIEGFTQAIATELSPLGINVTVVAPGSFRTDFLDPSSIKYAKKTGSINDYAKPFAEFKSHFDKRNHNQPGDPKKLANVIFQLTKEKNPPVYFMAGSDGVERAMSVAKERIATTEKWHDMSISTDGNWQ